MTDRARISPFLSRRSLILGGVSCAGLGSLAGCDQSDDPPPNPANTTPPSERPPRANNLQLQFFWRALNNAARTLGAADDVRFAGQTSYAPTREEDLDVMLASVGVSPGHRNYDIIRQLYMLGMGSVEAQGKLEDFLELRDLAEPVLESAYERALGECERGMSTCNVDLASKFNPPGSPGGAPDWVSAWWDFSSP